MIAVLLITFFSGANFFVLLLFWPTEVYNVYGKYLCQFPPSSTADNSLQALIPSALVSVLCPSDLASLAAQSLPWL